jgi:hypothetical protein
MDNFVVRSLLGREGMDVHIGGITHEHWSRAASLLSKFRVVAFVEDLDDNSTRQLFKRELSWLIGLGTTHENPSSERVAFSQDDVALIKNRTGYDMKLYNLFKERAQHTDS